MHENTETSKIKQDTLFQSLSNIKAWGQIFIVMKLDMQFGKYAGRKIADIPLRYLDETVSVMPPTLFVRLVQNCLMTIQIETSCDIMGQGRLPDSSFRDLFNDMMPMLNYAGNKIARRIIKNDDEFMELLDKESDITSLTIAEQLAILKTTSI